MNKTSIILASMILSLSAAVVAPAFAETKEAPKAAAAEEAKKDKKDAAAAAKEEKAVEGDAAAHGKKAE